MKPEEVAPSSEPTSLIEGDVIGDTAYSQRFVLKLLLKIANLETLQEALRNEESFENNLCILWDMSADKDVVLYLQENNALKLIHFALPAVSVPRIQEIMIGIVSNMCCHVELVREIMKMESFLNDILQLVRLYDTRILSVIFRLVDVCMFAATSSDIAIWLCLFDSNDFSEVLYFTLKNSTNRDVLVRALECFNTICTKCDNEEDKTNFFVVFVTKNAIESLVSGFIEVTVKQKEQNDDDITERFCNITIQIILTLTSLPFNKSHQIYEDFKEEIASVIVITLKHYINTFADDKIISVDLDEFGEPILCITKRMQLNQVGYNKFIVTVYDLWKNLNNVLNSKDDFKDRDQCYTSFEDDKEYIENINVYYSKTICYYLENCSEENLHKVLDVIVNDIDDLVDSTKDESIKESILQITSSYVSRIKENVDA